MEIKAIKRNNVGEQVFEQIRENIVRNEWKPGTKIPSENELTQMFGVSRVPIREALERLCALGILVRKQGEGTYVSEVNVGTVMNSLIPMLILNKKNMMDILQYREIMEYQCAALAANNRDEEDITNMKKTLSTMKRIGKANINFSKADLGFHLYVAKATKNNLIHGTYTIIREILIDYYKKINEIMGVERAIKYHSLILEAIIDKDENRARDLMKEHIDTTVGDIYEKYSE